MSRQGGLPRFQSQQAVGGQPVADTSGGARSLTELGQKIQSFGEQQLERTSINKAVQDGELAGINPNFKPSGAGSAATDAFNKAALQTNRMLMGTDVILNTQKLHRDASQSSPDAAIQLQNFNKASSQYSQQIINQSPTANKAYIQNMLNYHIGTVQNNMVQGIQAQQRIKASAQWLQSDNTFHADTLNSVNNIDFNQPKDDLQKQISASGALLAQRNNSTQLAASGGFITQSVANSQISKNNIEFNQELITAHFRSKLRDGGDNPQKFIEQVESASLKGEDSGALRGMNSTQRGDLAARLVKEQKIFLNSHAINKTDIAQQAKDEVARVQDGGTPNQNIRSAYSLHFPDKLGEFDNRIDSAQKVHSIFNGLESFSFGDQKRFLSENIPKDPNSTDFEKNKKIIETVESKINQQNHVIAQDPVLFFSNNPSVVNALNQKAQELKSGVNFELMNSNGIKPLSQNPIDNIVAAQIMKGIPLSKVDILTKGQGDRVATLLKSNSPTSDKIRSLRLLQSTYGKWYPQVMGQLTRDGKVSSTETFLGALDTNDPDLPAIDQALNTSKKELESNISTERLQDLQSSMQGSLDGKTSRSTIFPGFTKAAKYNRKLSDFEDSYLSFAANGTSKFLNNTKSFMNSVALSIMNQDKTISGSDAWLKASEKIAGKFNYTTLGGKTQRVPIQFSSDMVSKYAKRQEEKLKDFPFVLSRQSNGMMLNRSDVLTMNVKTGGWVTSPNNDGWQWVRQDGALLRDEKGNSFEFKFRDALSNHDDNHSESNNKFGDFQKPSSAESKAGEFLAKIATANFLSK